MSRLAKGLGRSINRKLRQLNEAARVLIHSQRPGKRTERRAQLAEVRASRPPKAPKFVFPDFLFKGLSPRHRQGYKIWLTTKCKEDPSFFETLMPQSNQ